MRDISPVYRTKRRNRFDDRFDGRAKDGGRGRGDEKDYKIDSFRAKDAMNANDIYNRSNYRC